MTVAWDGGGEESHKMWLPKRLLLTTGLILELHFVAFKFKSLCITLISSLACRFACQVMYSNDNLQMPLCLTAGLVFLILFLYSAHSSFLFLSQGSCLLILASFVCEVQMVVLAAIFWGRSLPSCFWDQLSDGASSRLRLPKAC